MHIFLKILMCVLLPEIHNSPFLFFVVDFK